MPDVAAEALYPAGTSSVSRKKKRKKKVNNEQGEKGRRTDDVASARRVSILGLQAYAASAGLSSLKAPREAPSGWIGRVEDRL